MAASDDYHSDAEFAAADTFTACLGLSAATQLDDAPPVRLHYIRVMPTLNAMTLPQPKNWQEFEDIVLAAYRLACRYFFNSYHDFATMDAVGREFTTPKAAWRQALSDARTAAACEVSALGTLSLSHRIEVMDNLGASDDSPPFRRSNCTSVDARRASAQMASNPFKTALSG